MFTWIKSMFTDLSAGSILVGAALLLVVALLVALGELASHQPDRDVVSKADPAASSFVTASANDTPRSAPRRSTVSVMVPMDSLR